MYGAGRHAILNAANDQGSPEDMPECESDEDWSGIRGWRPLAATDRDHTALTGVGGRLAGTRAVHSAWSIGSPNTSGRVVQPEVIKVRHRTVTEALVDG